MIYYFSKDIDFILYGYKRPKEFLDYILHETYFIDNYVPKFDKLTLGNISTLIYSIRYNMISRILSDLTINTLSNFRDEIIDDVEFVHAPKFIVFSGILLNKRKKLLPMDGAILLLKDSPNIEAIMLREHHLNENAIMDISVVYTVPNRHIRTYMIPLSLNNMYYIFDNYKDASINKDFPFFIHYILKLLDIEYDYDVDSLVEYDIISPYYWRYRNNNYYSPKEKEAKERNETVTRMFTIEVAPCFIPTSGAPKAKAIELSKKLCVEIPPGKTIRDGHFRTYHKDLIESDEITKTHKLKL